MTRALNGARVTHGSAQTYRNEKKQSSSAVFASVEHEPDSSLPLKFKPLRHSKFFRRKLTKAAKKIFLRLLNSKNGTAKSSVVEALKARLRGAAPGRCGHKSCCSKENMAMTTFNLAPLYRSTVGYDRLFDMLSDSIRPDWPPYNIEKMSDNDYRISMAVAGFSADEIELTQHGTNLLITGQKKADDAKHQMLHQGISSRNFKQTFSLADHVKVAAATMENGLLSIDLAREVPEALKPRTIEIKSSAKKVVVPESEPVQIGTESDAKRKAA